MIGDVRRKNGESGHVDMPEVVFGARGMQVLVLHYRYCKKKWCPILSCVATAVGNSVVANIYQTTSIWAVGQETYSTGSASVCGIMSWQPVFV